MSWSNGNDLHLAFGNWIPEISPKGNLQITEANYLTVSSTSSGTPFNILLDLGTNSESFSNLYFEIKLLELDGDISVGFATQDEFLPGGWRTKGMFYNGNITNGSAGLVIGVGKRPVKGDTVGVYLLKKSNKARVSNYLNGRSLGVAFEVDDANYMPCINITGSAKIIYSAPDSIPKTSDREYPKSSNKYEGDWKLIEAYAGLELGQVPLNDNNVILTFTKARDAAMYDLSVHIANRMGTNVKIVGQTEGFDNIEVSANVFSTMMMPSPMVYELEKFVMQSLPTFYKIKVDDNSTLILSGSEVEFICKRFYKAFPVQSNYK